MDTQYDYVEDAGSNKDVVSKKDAKHLIIWNMSTKEQVIRRTNKTGSIRVGLGT